MPILTPLLGAGISFGLSKIPGMGGPGDLTRSPTFQRTQQLGDLSKEFAFDYALPEGKQLLSSAENTLQKPIDYYSALLGGNRAEMMGAVAPEAKNIMSQYDQAKQNISKFTPYGGGQTSQLSELPFQEGGAIQNLIQTVRPQAATALGQLGGEQGALSGMVTGEGLTASGQAGQEFQTLMNAMLGKSSQSGPMQSQIGGGLAQLLLGGSGGGGMGGMMGGGGGYGITAGGG